MSLAGFCNRPSIPANSTCGKAAAGWFEDGFAGQTGAFQVLKVDEDSGIEQSLRVDRPFRGAKGLREKLGPILWQFPPFVAFDEDRFRAFLDLLPRNSGELARLARHHAPFLKKRVFLEPDEVRIRAALLPVNLLRNAQEQARTYYAGIASLLPGYTLLVTRDRLELLQFERLDPPPPIRYQRDQDYIDHFRHLFFQTVADRMRTDTRLGAMLSGGLDSSSIVAAVHEQYRS